MQFGYDENKVRVRPSFSGQKATCPLCKGTVIGKCGEIYIWHWQHIHDSDCDPWQEHETDWHREWKARFPEDWQEVVIENEEEKHRADVKTASGIVIEFQNSSISTSTIGIREDFYGNMIWVVNAIPFKSNFKIRSKVNSLLQSIERDASYELISLQDDYKEELKSISNDIEKNKKEKTVRFNAIKYKIEDTKKLNLLLNSPEIFINPAIEKWSLNEYYWSHQTDGITNKIESEFKSQLYETSVVLKKNQAEIKRNEQGLFDLLKLIDFQVADKLFKIIP